MNFLSLITFILGIAPSVEELNRMKKMFDDALKRHNYEMKDLRFLSLSEYEKLIGTDYNDQMTHSILASVRDCPRYYFQEFFETFHIFAFEMRPTFAKYNLWPVLKFSMHGTDIIIGRILWYYEDSLGTEYGHLGQERKILVDSVVMGFNIKKGDTIRVRSFGVAPSERGGIMTIGGTLEISGFVGDTVLVLLREFPSDRSVKIREEFKNDLFYKPSFYEGINSYLITRIYFDEKGEERSGILRIDGKPFDETMKQIETVIEIGKRWQNELYKIITPSLLDSIIESKIGEGKIVKRVRKRIEEE